MVNRDSHDENLARPWKIDVKDQEETPVTDDLLPPLDGQEYAPQLSPEEVEAYFDVLEKAVVGILEQQDPAYKSQNQEIAFKLDELFNDLKDIEAVLDEKAKRDIYSKMKEQIKQLPKPLQSTMIDLAKSEVAQKKALAQQPQVELSTSAKPPQSAQLESTASRSALAGRGDPVAVMLMNEYSVIREIRYKIGNIRGIDDPRVKLNPAIETVLEAIRSHKINPQEGEKLLKDMFPDQISKRLIEKQLKIARQIEPVRSIVRTKEETADLTIKKSKAKAKEILKSDEKNKAPSEENLLREMKTVMETIRRSVDNPKLSRRLAFDAALREIFIRGKYSKTEVDEICSKYLKDVQGLKGEGYNPNSDENRAFYGALQSAVTQKLNEMRFMKSKTDEAEKVAIQNNIPEGLERDKFVDNYLTKELTRRLLLPQIKSGRFADEKAIDDFIQSKIDSGSIKLLPDVTIDITTEDPDQGKGKTRSVFPPVVVVDAQTMAHLTNGEKEHPDRGAFFKIRPKSDDNEFDDFVKQKIGQEDIHVIAVLDETGNKDNTATLNHELTHWFLTTTKSYMRENISQLVTGKKAPVLVKEFLEESNITDPINANTNRYLEYMVWKIITKGAGKDINPADFAHIADQAGVSQEVVAGFMKWITDSKPQEVVSPNGDKRTRLTPQERFKKMSKAVDKIVGGISSPSEEIMTLGIDMTSKVSLSEIGAEKFDPENKQSWASLGLVRVYNKLWGEGTDSDTTFYVQHRKLLTQLMLKKIPDNRYLTPNGVINMLKELSKESQNADNPDRQNAAELISRFGLSLDQVILNQDVGSVMFNALSNLKNGLNDANTGVWEDVAKAIESANAFDPTIRKVLDIAVAKHDLEALVATLTLFSQPPTEDEEHGRALGVSNNADLELKKSGYDSRVRNWFDFRDGYGAWGRQNFKFGFLDSLPILGPAIENIAESLNFTSRAYKHASDRGPFGSIPILNRKYLLDAGLVPDDSMDRWALKDPLEGISEMFGLNLYRNKTIDAKRAADRELREGKWKADPKNKGKPVPDKWYDLKKPTSPDAFTQPGLNTYHVVTLQMLSKAMHESKISQSTERLMWNVIGGISNELGSLDPSIADWDKYDEYRMNPRLARFISSDEFIKRNHKDATWADEWKKKLTSDQYIIFDAKGNELPAIEISCDAAEAGAHANYQKFGGRMNKGSITVSLMEEIKEAVQIDFEENAGGWKKSQEKFEKIAKLMMTANIRDIEKGGYTIKNLANAITSCENNQQKMFTPSKAGYDPETGQYFSSNKEEMAERMANYIKTIKKPTIDFGIKGKDGEMVEVELKDAKEFIAYYYLARLKRITNVGIWGMQKEAQDGRGGTYLKPCAVDLDPTASARDYYFGKRQVSNVDNDYMMMSPTDYADPLTIMDKEALEQLNGLQQNGDFQYREYDKATNKIKINTKPSRLTVRIGENYAHDYVLGAIASAGEARWLSWNFTSLMRRIDTLRDMSKAKKVLWEGQNNLDDELRTLTLIYSVTTYLVGPLTFLFNPWVPLALIAWSAIVSPYINRMQKGWGERDKSAAELGTSLIAQYADHFYGLAEDTFHTPNEVRHARSTFEAIKVSYKRLINNMTEQGDPDSNFIASKARGLLAKYL